MPSSSTTARAGGKIILLGEHSVVYGHRALAGAIDRGVVCRAAPNVGPTSLDIPAWNISVTVEDDGLVASALRALAKASGSGPCALFVESTLPPAAGLGSSAALSLAIARCLAPTASDAEHRAIAAAGEGEFHESPSGIDVALSQSGGIAAYDKTTGLTPLDVEPLPIVVGLSRMPRSTKEQVAGVAARMRSDEGKTRERIDAMGAITEAGIRALLGGDLASLGTCMNECHRALVEIGVSIPTLDGMVEIARSAGATGAKLTGAGGGGAIIALAPGREEEVRTALEEKRFESFVTTAGARS